MPKSDKLTDASLRDLLAAGIPVPQIALLCRMSVEAVERWMARLERQANQERQRQEEVLRRATSRRPFPPPQLTDRRQTESLFRPAPDLWKWAKGAFIDPEAILENGDHWHLRFASVGMLWTNVPNRRGGRAVVGQCEMPRGQGGKWSKARHDAQLCAWFGQVPDFLITLDAGYAARADNATFCCLIEHELYHAGQAQDEFEGLKFNKDDEPIFAMKGHGCEEHPEVVRRYGVGAAAGGVAELVAAAGKVPLVAPAEIARACGTCRPR